MIKIIYLKITIEKIKFLSYINKKTVGVCNFKFLSRIRFVFSTPSVLLNTEPSSS